jgi:serine/threonine protein phosphatase 1
MSNAEKDFAKKIETVKNLFNKERLLLPKYKEMFESLPYYYELEDFLLVHAGFDFSKDNIYSNVDAMLTIRFWETDLLKTHGKKIIHGHQPTFKNKIKVAVRHKNNRIPLDNGCVYALSKEHKYNKIGSLCCLELNSMKLTFQKNIDK